MADDGIGVAPGPADGEERTFGLSGMKQRATILGARFTLGPRPGGGTELIVER